MSALLIVPSTAVAAGAPMVKFKNCKQVHKQFPHGLAMSKAAADLAVDRGMKAPRVRLRLALTLSTRFKTDEWTAIGVVCPVAAPIEVPQSPSGFEASITGEDYVYLKWDAPYDRRSSAPSYEVRGPGVITPRFDGSAKVEGLEPGVTYEFLLVAINSAGESSPSALSVTTRARPQYDIPDTGTPEPLPTFDSGYSLAGYYATCADARRAGVPLPIRDYEQPGVYNANTHLDRDGDGTACEWG